MIKLQQKQKEAFIKNYLIMKVNVITEKFTEIANLTLSNLTEKQIDKSIFLVNRLSAYLKKVYEYSNIIDSPKCNIQEIIKINYRFSEIQKEINLEYRKMNMFNDENQSMLEDIVNNYTKEISLFESYYNSPICVLPSEIDKIVKDLLVHDPALKEDLSEIIPQS